MPLSYGEGNDAFIKLGEEIIKGSDNYLILPQQDCQEIERDGLGRVAWP